MERTLYLALESSEKRYLILDLPHIVQSNVLYAPLLTIIMCFLPAWGNLLAGHLLVSFSCGHLLVGSITWPKLLVDICLLGQILVGHLLVGKCLWTFTCRTFPCGTFTCNHHFAQGNIRTTALPGKLKWERNIQLISRLL